MNSRKSPNEIIQELRRHRRNKISVTKVGDRRNNGPNRKGKNERNNNSGPANQNLRRRNLHQTSNLRIRNRRAYKNTQEENGLRLQITNLHPKTTNYELKSMFERFGPLKRCGIHWNDLGLSKGTADIEYMYPQDARIAKQEYDGKNMSGRNLSVQWSKNNRDSRRRVVVRNKLGGVNRGQQQRRDGESNGNVRNGRENLMRGMQRKSFNRGGLNKYNKF